MLLKLLYQLMILEKLLMSLKIRFPKIQGPDVKDICYATQNRQKAVRDLADCSDIVLVLGNKNSSNSVRLAEISSLTGVPTYRISDKNEVKLEWFDNAFVIGITAGASTPEILVEELVGFLKEKYGKNIDVEILDGTKEKVNFNLPKELID